MPVDTSIYGQIQQPQPVNQLANLAQAYQLKGLQSQMDRADREEAQQNKLLQLVGDPTFSNLDAKGKARALQSIGAFDKAGELIKSEAAANKDQRAADTSDFELKFKKLDAAANIAGSVTDQASYERGLQMIKELGYDTSKFNPQYDPNGVRQFAMATLSAKDKLANEMQRMQFGETQRHNRASEGISAGNLGVAQANLGLRRQELDNARNQPKGQIVQTETGPMLVDPRTGEAKPLTADGVPISKAGGKMTEDQGKATGWLVQAENAFSNMKKAGFDEKGNRKSAATPGVADVIAGSAFGSGLGNMLRSEDRQKFVQSSSSLSEALLRAATGAGVNADEAKQKIQELTPVWGESAGTTQQKMEAIPLYIESLKVRAGPGAAKAEAVLSGSGKPGPNIDELLKKYQ